MLMISELMLHHYPEYHFSSFNYFCCNIFSSVDSSTTAQLTESLKTLNLSSPPAGVSPAQFFKQLLSVIERVNPNQRAMLIGEPLCNARLSDDQWQLLQQIAMDLGNIT